MATTGDLPPNTRSGQNFIHDPKVAGETEVKAQIKLRFYNASNRSFIVVRSFQLTQKKNGLTFKALDQTLTHVDDGGNQVALTNRCADMNAMVPAVMGVSKAILENVIFVHQEDSNWPLAEGTVLKKRFDDIFAATKYTKALEELRKTKTRQVQDAKEMRLKLETLKTHKDQAARLRSTVRANTDRAATLRANIDSLEGRMADIQAALAAVNEKLLSMADYGDDIVSLKARYDTLDAKNAETYARLAASFPEDDLEHSVAALEELERDLGPQVAQLDGNIKTLERDANSARMKADALRDQGEKELATHSRLKAEADAHVRSVADRDQFLKEINGESYFGTDPFTQEEVSELKARFQGRLEAGREALKQAQSRRQLEEDAVGQELDAVAARISGAAEGVKMKQEAVRSNDARLTEIQAQLDRLDATAGGGDAALDAAKARKRDVEGRLAAKEAELAACSSADDGQRLSETLAAVASQIDILRAERAGLAAAADEASKMNYKAQELAVAEKKLETLLSRQRGNLTMVLGTTELPAPGPMLVEAVETVIAIRQVEEDTAKTALKAVQDELAGVKGSLAATESQLKRADAEATSLAGQLASGMAGSGGQSVGTRVQKLEEERTDKSNRVQQNNAFVLIVDHLCQVAEKENKCMSCDRKFATPAERGTFVAKKKEELKRLPEKVDDLKKQVKELEAKLDQLRLLEPAAARSVRRCWHLPEFVSSFFDAGTTTSILQCVCSYIYFLGSTSNDRSQA